jgi:GNAT superfamily N-acetyltransferase
MGTFLGYQKAFRQELGISFRAFPGGPELMEEWFRHHYSSLAGPDFFGLVCQDGTPVGAVGFFVEPHDRNRGRLSWLFVDPRHRGKGVGTTTLLLAEKAMKGMDGCAVLVCLVREEQNPKLIRFFEGRGYQELGWDLGELTLIKTLS